MKKNTAFVLAVAIFLFGIWMITHALKQDATKITTWIQMLTGVGLLALPFHLLEIGINAIVKAATAKELAGEGPNQGLKQQSQTGPRKTRIYLVAKVTGLPPREVRSKYAAYKKILEESGYEAVIPTEHVHPDSRWHAAMKVCIPLLISCDYYMTIGEPHTSTGATIEVTIAEWLQIPRAIMDEPTEKGEKTEFIFEGFHN